jgi:hypothetical protein
MADSTDPFDDPYLKAAVQRCWGRQCAPADLHERIRSLCSGAANADERDIRFRIAPIVWGLSAAAIVVIVVGLVFRSFSNPSITRSNQQPANIVAITLPSALQAELVTRHDLCCSHGDHQHLPVSKTDDAGMVRALREQLGRAVLVARPTEPGWNFRGAAVCPVGNVPSGHLVFARGSDTLSIFSLPKSAAPQLQNGQEFTMAIDHHLIAGFEKDGALFCLVANSPSGTITASTLLTMRSQMEPAVETAQMNTPTDSGNVAELLRPVMICENRN